MHAMHEIQKMWSLHPGCSKGLSDAESLAACSEELLPSGLASMSMLRFA